MKRQMRKERLQSRESVCHFFCPRDKLKQFSKMNISHCKDNRD